MTQYVPMMIFYLFTAVGFCLGMEILNRFCTLLAANAFIAVTVLLIQAVTIYGALTWIYRLWIAKFREAENAGK